MATAKKAAPLHLRKGLKTVGTTHTITGVKPDEDAVNLSGAGLLLTYWCNARCAHCYERSGPERRGWMSLEAAREHFAALVRLGVPASGVHVGGGEPFGNYELLL